VPLDPFLVEAAVASGLSAVCSTCRKYWEGRERGLPEPRCTAVSKCGSPLAGDDFHEYEGPMREFDRWCFVCAKESKYALKMREGKRLIGVCDTHVRMLADLKPVDATVMGGPILRSASGHSLLPEDVIPKRKPSLAQAIADAEKSFEKES
jgi:hypothetical protein